MLRLWVFVRSRDMVFLFTVTDWQLQRKGPVLQGIYPEMSVFTWTGTRFLQAANWSFCWKNKRQVMFSSSGREQHTGEAKRHGESDGCSCSSASSVKLISCSSASGKKIWLWTRAKGATYTDVPTIDPWLVEEGVQPKSPDNVQWKRKHSRRAAGLSLQWAYKQICQKIKHLQWQTIC